MLKLLPFLLVCSVAAVAQIPGKRVDGPVTLASGVSVKENDLLLLGRGTDRRGDFTYIYQPPNVLIGIAETSLPRRFANTEVVVKYFKLVKNKRHATEKLVAIVNPHGGLNHLVDLDAAIEQGEIVAINGNRVGPSPQASATPEATASLSDELGKLKKLFDDKAITQDEYDAAKKKLLNQ